MKRLSTFLLVPLTMLSLTSCGGFMQGLASGLAGYGGGGYYVAPAPAMNASAGFNSFPAATFTAPAATYTAPAPTYTPPAPTYGTGASSSSSTSSTPSSSSSSGRSCGVCYGLGKCRTCNGNGTYWDSLNGNRKKCPNCTNGLCTSCGGSGKK